MAREPDDAVRCRGVVKRFGDVVALDGLDLGVGRGTVVGGRRSSRALSLALLIAATPLLVRTGARAIERRDSRTA